MMKRRIEGTLKSDAHVYLAIGVYRKGNIRLPSSLLHFSFDINQSYCTITFSWIKTASQRSSSHLEVFRLCRRLCLFSLLPCENFQEMDIAITDKEKQRIWRGDYYSKGVRFWKKKQSNEIQQLIANYEKLVVENSRLERGLEDIVADR